MIIQKFEEQVKRTPDKIAVKTAKHSVTYSALSEYADRIASLIHCKGQEHEQVPGADYPGNIGLLIDHGIDMIAAILGTLKSGKAYVPISYDYPVNRIIYMLNHSEASLVLTNSKCEEKAHTVTLENSIPVLNIDNVRAPGSISSSIPDRETDGEHLAYIMYTSGSTGKPKGVMQNHQNVLYYIENWTRCFSISDSDRMTLLSSFCHDGSGQDMFGALLNGAALYPYDVRNLESDISLSRFIIKEKITIWHSVPSLYHFFVNTMETGERFDGLKYILLGGEAFRGYEIETYKKYFPHCLLANVYGQTESSVDSIWTIRAQDTIKRLIIGEPLDDTRIYVVDEEGNEVEPFESGEILVACRHISPGYWRDEEATRKAFLEDPDIGRIYCTGDLGRLLTDGNIEFMGRRDFQVKIRGFRVEIGEIETCLLRMGDIQEAVVVPRQTESSDTYLCAFIVAKEELDLTGLRQFLSRELPDYMIPTSFFQIDRMPLTQSNKTDRRALAMMEAVPLKLGTAYVPPETDMEKIVAGIWKEVLGVDDVGTHDNLFDIGGNSFDVIKINNKLKELLKRDIPIVKLFEYPTVSTSANYLTQGEGEKDIPGDRRADKEQPAKKTPRRSETSSGVAVIGMAGRFPGAKNIHEFWNNLKQGKETINFFSDEELLKAGVSPELLQNRDYVKAGSILYDIEYFDAPFFGYTPKEAEIMNPQIRMFYECVYEALEDAGYASDHYDGSIGLYAGASINYNWEAAVFFSGKMDQFGEFVAATLANKDSLSARIAYKLNLKGPALSIRTACSTSLVAVHLACQGLSSGECDIALAGGITIHNVRKNGYLYEKGLVVSPDGHCRPFDARAMGTIFGDGSGVVVLKTMETAIQDGDNIYAVIKGSAINNDGYRKVGYTAPSVEGQADVIIAAQVAAGVDAESIGYIETHGTGTHLGDTIEFEALKIAFRTEKRHICGLGSVKSNVGHLDSAAGIAGFIKTALALKNRVIPPCLYFETPNPEIDFGNSPFFVNTQPMEWKNDRYPLRAGVSSFGFGGTNAHVVLEEAPLRKDSPAGRKWQLFLLSAKTEKALERSTVHLVNQLKRNPAINLADAAYTLRVGRRAFKYRRMAVCSTLDEAIDLLSTGESGKSPTFTAETKAPQVVFMFPGLGAQYVNMGLDLYQEEPVFREAMDHCFGIVNPLLGWDMKEILYPAVEHTDRLPDINQPEIAQLVIFIFEYALAQLLMGWGINPQALIGYSFGEYVAACIAGVFLLEDALKLVVSRGQLIQKMPPGAMLSVPLPQEDVIPLLNSELSLAIDNGPSCIVAGAEKAVEAFESRMKEKKILCVRVAACRAIHSRMMAPISNEFERVIAQFTLNKPQIPFISNVTGTWVDDKEVVKPAYWVNHLQQTVQFAAGMKELVKEDKAVFIEIGPGQDLSALALRYIDKEAGQRAIYLVRHPQKNISDAYFLLNKIGRLWLYGVKLDWFRFSKDEKRFRISLPTYPFERQRYWIDQALFKRDISSLAEISPFNKTRSLFYVPSWKPCALPGYLQEGNPSSPGYCWLMFIAQSGLSSRLLKQLENQGEKVVCVTVGTGFKKVKDFNYTIHPRKTENYEMLLLDLLAMGLTPRIIVHLWSISKICDQELEFDQVHRAQKLGLYSLLNLAWALGNRQRSVEDRIQIKVITNNMQKLPGDEVLCPEKAPVLAAVKMIPHHYPNIKCASIDILIPRTGTWQETRLIKQLLAELKYEYSEQVIAYRGNDRLAQAYEPIKLGTPGKATSRLKDGGVYLITNGLEGKGFEMARYIAQASRSKLILIESPASPSNYQDDQHLSTNNNHTDETFEPHPENFYRGNMHNLNLNEEIGFLDRVEREIEKELGLRELNSFEGLEETLNKLCSSYILDYFRRNSINTEPGRVYKKEDLRNRLEILPKFDKFYDFFIKVLSEDHILRVRGSHIEFLRDAAEVENPRLLSEDALKKYPEFRGTIELLEYCTAHYSKALNGEIEAVAVLYPEGSNVKCEDKYIDSVQYSKEELYIQVLRELVAEVIRKLSPGRTIRILEIGAGHGLLTRKLIPVLKNQDVEYHFTDIGNFFVVNAKKEAAQQRLSFMKFGTFDISKDPTEEGYENYSFDMILGLNVVHMVKFIKEALGNLKQLLVPNGIIGLIEITEPKRWRHLINGLAEGWWFFEDSDLRKDSSLLSLNTWEEVFKKLEFQNVHSFPTAPERKFKTNCGLIVAQQEGQVKSSDWFGKMHENKLKPAGGKIRNLKHLERLADEVQVMDTDVGDLEQMKETMTRVEKEFGRVSGVIHCAGVMGKKGEIRENSQEVTASILEPRVKSLLVLDKMFADRALDFLVICSSLNQFGNPVGKIGEAAVLNFFDSFAHYKLSRNGRFVLSIDWNPSVKVPIGNVFDLIIGHSFAQVILSPRNPRDLSAQAEKYHETDTEGVHVTAQKYQRSELSSEYAVPRNRIEKVLTEIWEEFLGIKQVGIYDDFLELGADSLVFITIASKIHQALNAAIPITEFFNTPTVAGIAQYILNSEKKSDFEPLYPAEKKEFYLLSPAQKRMYFAQQMKKESISYNIPTFAVIKGNFNQDRLKDCFNRLMKRHESLRTFFILKDHIPVQVINDHVEVKIEYYCLEGGEADLVELPIEVEKIVKNFVSPFDLSKVPLFKVGLIKIVEGANLLMVDTHHIISDGVSQEIMVEEFTALYRGENLVPLRIQYKDFAGWQNRLFEAGLIKGQEEYWLNRFKDDIQILKLPTDFPRPAGNASEEGDSLTFHVEEELTVRLYDVLKSTEITTYMFLLAVYNILLSKFTGQTDIIVVSPISGRRHIDHANTIGMFVNMLPMRNQPEKDKTFREFLEHVKENALNAYENQDYQYTLLVSKLGLQGKVNGNSLLNTVFTMQTLTSERRNSEYTEEINDFTITPYKFSKNLSAFDLHIIATETNKQIKIEFEYQTHLFKHSTIQNISKNFTGILAQVLDNPDMKLKEIEVTCDLVTMESKKIEDGQDFGFEN